MAGIMSGIRKATKTSRAAAKTAEEAAEKARKKAPKAAPKPRKKVSRQNWKAHVLIQRQVAVIRLLVMSKVVVQEKLQHLKNRVFYSSNVHQVLVR